LLRTVNREEGCFEAWANRRAKAIALVRPRVLFTNGAKNCNIQCCPSRVESRKRWQEGLGEISDPHHLANYTYWSSRTTLCWVAGYGSKESTWADWNRGGEFWQKGGAFPTGGAG